MKKCGREVLFIPTGEGNPRNGESSFVRLKDGGIMHAYTEYFGDSQEDEAIARLCAVISHDEGESWGERMVLLEKAPEEQNIMSPSLFRMRSGDLGMVYLRKMDEGESGITCMPVCRSSSDEGKSWSDFRYCVEELGYYCGINDVINPTQSGRIWLPLSYHGLGYREGHMIPKDMAAEIRFAYSDDDGKTWHSHNNAVCSPYEDIRGFAEPGIMELPDGRLWSWFRSGYGFQYQSYSSDGGKTWSAPIPNFFFTSPDAPMRIRKVGEYTIAVWNPIPLHAAAEVMEIWESGKRSPLACAVSLDGGLSFDCRGKCLAGRGLKAFKERVVLLEDDPLESYCYPAIIEVKDGFLVSYYHSNGEANCLNCTKIIKVGFDELETL